MTVTPAFRKITVIAAGLAVVVAPVLRRQIGVSSASARRQLSRAPS